MIERIICADALEGLKQIESGSADMCVTSPPYYGLRDYGIGGQIGLEDTPELYIERLVEVFREVRRVLKDDGTLWVNIADSYAGGAGRWEKEKNISSMQATNRGSFGQLGIARKWQHDNIKQKDLIGIPWMLAFALRADGWYLRNDIIWHKPNPMPESVTDRCTKAHEYIFLLSKERRYYFDHKAIQEPVANDTVERRMRAISDEHKYVNGANGQKAQTINRPRENIKNLQEKGQPLHTLHTHRVDGAENLYEMRNKRSVWSVSTRGYSGAHFAVYPPELIRPCILAGSRIGGTVIDPFFGSGTTGIAALEEQRGFIGIELNPEYVDIAQTRINEAYIQYKIAL